jgi:uncharacterized protein YqjF (DUF2071 family)
VGVLFQNDFDRRAMDQLAHRPYAMPTAPWLMTQTWHHVLFLHWPVDDRMLRELLPDGLELDVCDGQAYVAITPFYMTRGAGRRNCAAGTGEWVLRGSVMNTIGLHEAAGPRRP